MLKYYKMKNSYKQYAHPHGEAPASQEQGKHRSVLTFRVMATSPHHCASLLSLRRKPGILSLIPSLQVRGFGDGWEEQAEWCTAVEVDKSYQIRCRCTKGLRRGEWRCDGLPSLCGVHSSFYPVPPANQVTGAL